MTETTIITAAPAGREVRAARSLPVPDWPEADRVGWEAACQPGQRLIRGGAASHLALITQADLARRYGYFLDFLDRSGLLDRTAEAGTLVTPEAVVPFVAELQERVSSVTVSRTIYKVRRAAECIAPDLSFAWLAEIGKDLALLERPKDKFDRLVRTERLVEAGLTLFQEAEADIHGLPLGRAFAARNGLMVALLALCPIRLKNFAALEIGSTLSKLEDVWWIDLSETKSGRPDHRPVPTFLTGFIERYLDIHRPVLLQRSSGHEARFNLGNGSSQMQTKTASPKNTTTGLWISRLGCPLKCGSVAWAVTETVRMTLGVPVNPHLFRSAGATTAALQASKSPHLASALLQHTDSKTTEAHYIRASSLSVARDFAALIGHLRTP